MVSKLQPLSFGKLSGRDLDPGRGISLLTKRAASCPTGPAETPEVLVALSKGSAGDP